MRYKALAILIISIFCLQLSGQIITVNSGFDTDSIMIGDQVNYSINVESADDVMVHFPEYSDTITEQLEILKSSDIDTSWNEDRRILSRNYVVTSFDPGWNTVAPQPVIFDTGEYSDTTYTRALLLTVLAPAIDTTLAIKPIKPPVNTPVSFAEIFPWALLVLGIGLLIFLGIYLYRRYVQKKEHPELFQRKPLEPAHVIAFRDLDTLKGEKLPQNGRVKEYYTRLTEIIRVYITRQYNIHAMESTTAEILDAFSLQNTKEDELKLMLENLLMLADLVKFAKEDPLMEENERHFANANYFVENTYRLFMAEEELTDWQKDNQGEEMDVELMKEEGSHG